MSAGELELGTARPVPAKSMAAQVYNSKNELIDYESFASNARGAAGEGPGRGVRGVPAPRGRGWRMDFETDSMVTVNTCTRRSPTCLEPTGAALVRDVIVDEVYQDTNHATDDQVVRESGNPGGGALFANAKVQAQSSERRGRLDSLTPRISARVRPVRSCESSVMADQSISVLRSGATDEVTHTEFEQGPPEATVILLAELTVNGRTSSPAGKRSCPQLRPQAEDCGPRQATVPPGSPATSRQRARSRRSSSPRRSTGTERRGA